MANPVLLGANNAPQAKSMMTALTGLVENGGRVGQIHSDRKVFTPLTVASKKESPAPQAPQAPQAVLAKVTGGNSVTGYTVDLYANGPYANSTGKGIAYVTESNLQLNSISVGAWIITQSMFISVVG